MLAANIPYFEVDGRVRRWECDGSDVLPHRGNSLQVGIGRRVCAFQLLEKRGFAGVVETEEQDGVLLGTRVRHSACHAI